MISRKLFVFGLFCLVGCAYFAPIGPIVSLGILWANGEASKYYASDVGVIHVAIKNVLEEFKIPILEEKTEDDIIYLKAGDDDRFKIKIVPVREKITKLMIRINTMGDKSYTEFLFRHVDKQKDVEQFASLKELNENMSKRSRNR